MPKVYSAGDPLLASEYNQIVKVTGGYAASAAGSDTYAVTVSPAPGSLVAGDIFHFKADVGNTGACTLNVNSLGATTIKKNIDQDLETGDILAGQMVVVQYDGTNFQLLTVGDVPFKSSTSSTDQIAAADTQRSTSNASYTKLKEIQVLRNGVINVYFEFQKNGDSTNARVYINGVAVGTERTETVNDASWEAFNEDFTVQAGDLVQLYAKDNGAVGDASVRYFRIRAYTDVLVVTD